MKNFKIGFTLAEVLVTMGILGVIGALLVPQLATNIQKNEAGILLGNTAEQISLGVKNLIQHANDQSSDGSFFDTYGDITTNDLFQNGQNTSIRGNNLFSTGGAFFQTTALNDNTYSVSNYSGASDEFSQAINGANKYRYEKNGSYIIVLPTENNNDTLGNILDVVVIDVNGKNNPNKFGKDVFMFGLTNDGNMIPAGTQRFSNAFSNDDVLKSIPTNSCNGNNITNGLSCTARVVKDGFKINY